MDLSTIGRKLQRAQYLSPEDFAHDTRLVFQNAITYNSAQSMFGVVAGILASSFDRRYTLITQAAAIDPGRPMPDRPGWPTFAQKKKLYDLCTKLSLADLNQMVQMVQKGCQAAVQQCGHKEVEVDVDELDMDTFNKARSAPRLPASRRLLAPHPRPPLASRRRCSALWAAKPAARSRRTSDAAQLFTPARPRHTGPLRAVGGCEGRGGVGLLPSTWVPGGVASEGAPPLEGSNGACMYLVFCLCCFSSLWRLTF